MATAAVICPKKGCGAILDPVALIGHMKTHAIEEDQMTEQWSEFDPKACQLDNFDYSLLED